MASRTSAAEGGSFGWFRRQGGLQDSESRLEHPNVACRLQPDRRHVVVAPPSEDVVPELRSLLEPGAGGADAVQHGQPVGEGLRRRFGPACFLHVLRQQQPRFEPDQPRRHHQPVGRARQVNAPNVRGGGQVLIDEGSDRDLAEVNFLPARQLQQQIERARKPVEPQQDVIRRGRVSFVHADNLTGTAMLSHASLSAPRSAVAKAKPECNYKMLTN